MLHCLVDQHRTHLFLLGALVCGMAAVTAVLLLSRAQSPETRHRTLWTVGAALEFGAGVWSLHFIALLAFVPIEDVSTGPAGLAVSLLVAVAATLGAFRLAARPAAGPVRLAATALLLAAAIGGLHYTGILSLRAGISLGFAPVLVSLLAGLLLLVPAAAAMADLSRLPRRAAAAAFLLLAVAAIHFGGMHAMTRDGAAPGPPASAMPALDALAAWRNAFGPRCLAATVVCASLALLLASLLLVSLERLMVDRSSAERLRLRKLSAVSFEGLLIARRGVIIDANDRVCLFAGRPLADLVGTPVASVLPAYCPSPSPRPGKGPPPEHTLRRAAGADMPVELLAEEISYGGIDATAIAIRDLTAKRDSEAALYRIAHHDPLTGLPNRLLLETRMRQMLAAPHGGAAAAGAVLCLDLDRFKSVNDLFGHPAGDELLVAVGNRLAALLRHTDTLARLGGDEFVILLPTVEGAEQWETVARRIVRRMAEPVELRRQTVVINVSVGVTVFPWDGHDADLLLRCADIAMYAAKDAGGGTYRRFAPAMDFAVRHRHALERDLREALERRALALHYQPLVGCDTAEIEGYEALLRWEHPERGFVSPAEFIPIAEESGLILPLGQWVLETACRAAACWAAPLRVAVNLSPVQFRRSELVDIIIGVLGETGLPATRLEVEVTESVLVDDPERAVATLSRLRALGVAVSLDDFGTGYSSLSYLRQFPLDKIKIDRSFIADLGTNQKSGRIVRAVVDLAHSLGLSVTAEGVETEDQLDVLRAQSCNQVQGFLLGAPAPLDPAGADPDAASGRRLAERLDA